MIRNFMYTVLGLAIFISGGILGPKIWLVMQGNTEISNVESSAIPHEAAESLPTELANNNSEPENAFDANIKTAETKADNEPIKEEAKNQSSEQVLTGEVVFSTELFTLKMDDEKKASAEGTTIAQKDNENKIKQVPQSEELNKNTELTDAVKADNAKTEIANVDKPELSKTEAITSSEDDKKLHELATTEIKELASDNKELNVQNNSQQSTEDQKLDIADNKSSIKEEFKENFLADKKQTVKTQVEEGDNLIEIFKDYTDHKSAYNLAKTIGKVHPVTRIQIGKNYTLEHDTEKEKITYFEYEISDTQTLIVDCSNETPKVFIEKVDYEKKLSFVKGEIEGSLYGTMLKLNEKESLALTVVNMFKWDINFIKDIRKGDSFSILVEKLYLNGQFKGYGRTIGGTFTNNGKTLESFLYHDGNRKEMHYNAKGENMRKVLLQSPLRFTRVTSGYTYRRRHPVYGTYRPHLGIDYGAPTGTPIMAVGGGTVTYLGWRGGFGKHITVRHASGLESLYSHLSRYGRSLRKGSKVRQGQIIGYVGSTGVSTGPHLDFRLKQNGKYINPSKAINPRAASISRAHKQGYEARKKLIREFMNGTRPLESYDPSLMDMVVAEKKTSSSRKNRKN